MKEIEVKTGFGYYKDEKGRVIGKAQLPTGFHPGRDGVDYFDVPDQAALDLIVVDNILTDNDLAAKERIEAEIAKQNAAKAEIKKLDISKAKDLDEAKTELGKFMKHVSDLLGVK